MPKAACSSPVNWSRASSGAEFDNLSPATGELLGTTAAADKDDMDRAIGAARVAFDTTDWSTNRSLRKRCLEQLQAAIEGEKEELREELIAEVGCPAMTTESAQLDWPLAESLRYPAHLIDAFEWERVLDGGGLFGDRNVRTVVKEAVGVVAAVTPSNFPIEVILNKLGPALAAGNTVVLKPDPNTPWNATRLGRLIAERTDIPPGVVNVVTTPSNDVAEHPGYRPARRPRVLHRLDRRRQAADAPGRRHDEADVPRARRQVRGDRPRRRQPCGDRSDGRVACVCTRGRRARRPAGC